MSIDVREIVIKALVSQEDAGTGGGGGGAAAAGADNNSVSPNEQIVNICVQRILEILKDKNER